MQRAFIAAEDRHFYQHKGIDERGLIRAFVSNLAQAGRSQGGSTITQQLVKNLLVGDDLTYERKIREIIVAARVERTLNKAKILELYLNSVYFGRVLRSGAMSCRLRSLSSVMIWRWSDERRFARSISSPSEIDICQGAR